MTIFHWALINAFGVFLLVNSVDPQFRVRPEQCMPVIQDQTINIRKSDRNALTIFANMLKIIPVDSYVNNHSLLLLAIFEFYTDANFQA
ncbi:hypothetical protein Tsp_08231 [Trichinella spiralis]|uniref:hypothetical protein n=1 Tax=Trichinella spiralis TaxID=6334 RepID=UPI0001EFEA5F|nr:hypothetical protein Tsp_08231 [Trichinella spiralis]